MHQGISSSQTFFMKWIFPPLWILIFGIGSVMIWIERSGQPPHQDGPLVKLVFLTILIVGTISLLRMCAPLKRVRIDGSCLYISNYRTEVRVPFTSISDVTENRWIKIHPVTIHFKTSTQFGKSIVFMPKTLWFSFLGSHPVVAELRALAGLRAT